MYLTVGKWIFYITSQSVGYQIEHQTVIMKKIYCSDDNTFYYRFKPFQRGCHDLYVKPEFPFTLVKNNKFWLQETGNNSRLRLLRFVNAIDAIQNTSQGETYTWVAPSEFKGQHEIYKKYLQTINFPVGGDLNFMEMSDFVSHINNMGVEEAASFQMINHIDAMKKTTNKLCKALSVCEQNADFAVKEISTMKTQISNIEYAQNMYVDRFADVNVKLKDIKQQMQEYGDVIDKHQECFADIDIADIQNIKQDVGSLICKYVDTNDCIKGVNDSIFNIEKLLMNTVADVKSLTRNICGLYENKRDLKQSITDARHANDNITDKIKELFDKLIDIQKDVAYLKINSPMIEL